jgi:hypothetical protein
MRRALVLCLAAAAALSAQVKFSSTDNSITIDGKPFATFNTGEKANKPFLAPIRSASGKVVTRGFPMEMLPGESRDHLHHRGLWFTYDDVNGVKFWENDPSYTKGKIGRVIVKSTSWKDGKSSGTLTVDMEWCDPAGKVLLTEHRDMVFRPDPALRTIDFLVTLTAATGVTLGDTKEGAFAIRLAENFTERRGGRITDSEGRAGMKNIWGKRAAWVDYSGEIDGEKLGVAIFDHPSNPHYPTYWHARDYGLFSLNPFGQQAFDPNAAENLTNLKPGDKLTFRWRVVIHPGDAASAGLADLYKQFAASR